MNYFRLAVIVTAVMLLSSACQKQTPPTESSVSSPTRLPLEFKNEALGLPSGLGALAPNFFSDGTTIYMVWLQKSSEASPIVQLHYAELQDGLWGNHQLLHTSDKFFANWADIPTVTVNEADQALIHWAEKSGAATYAYDVRYGLLEADTFRDLGVIHQDKTQTEHGFVSVVPSKNTFEIFWLDGRHTGGGGHDGQHHGASSSAMTLRHATLGPNGLSKSTELDERVCDCCNTAAIESTSGMTVAYRDRSADEIRDISVIHRRAGQWGQPQQISQDQWKISGCPVNGPALAQSRGTSALAWFTKASGRGEVNIKFSTDGGGIWGPTYSVDANDPIGRVDLISLPNGQFVVSWLGKDKDDAVINLRRVGANGTMTPTTSLQRVSASRQTGIPQVALSGHDLAIVWTESTDATTTLTGRLLSWQAIGTPLLTKPPKPTDEATTPINDIADLKVSNRDGQLVKVAANGQHQLVAFWADWCRPCWEELPVLETLRTQHGLKVTLVTTRHADVRGLESSIQDRGFKGPIYYVDNEDFPAELQLNQLPTSWVVNKDGGIESRLTGLLRLDDPIIVKVTMGKR